MSLLVDSSDICFVCRSFWKIPMIRDNGCSSATVATGAIGRYVHTYIKTNIIFDNAEVDIIRGSAH